MRFITRRNIWDELFEDFRGPVGYNCRTDIYEDDKGLYFEIEVPGFKKENIKVELRNQYLNISVQHEESEEENANVKYLVRGRRNFEISRSYKLKEGVTEEDIKVKLENGILYVTVLKVEKVLPASKTISIE